MDEHDTFDLSIIIPAYQEAKIIGQTLDSLAAFLGSNQLGSVEVLVVVANSPDDTADIARGKSASFSNLRVIDAGERVGKGRDTRLGMMEATGRYKLFMDADLATPLHHILEVKTLMDANAEIGIAVRDLWRIHHGLLRKLISKSSNIAAQILVTPGVKDTQCGFKVFRADVAHELFTRQTMLAWSFDAEILAIARKLGFRISYIPCPDWRDPKSADMGLSGDSPLKAAFRSLIDLFIIRWNIWTNRYTKVGYEQKQ